MLFLISAVVVFKDKSWAIDALLIFYGLRYLTGCAGGTAWNSIIRDFIPQKIMGRYFANRIKYTTIAGIIASIFGSLLVDAWKKASPETMIYAYSFIIFLALIAGIVNTTFFLKIPEPPMPSPKENEPQISFFTKMKAPFLDPNYRKLMFFIGSWNFALNFATPFFVPYLLKAVNLSIFSISCLTIISQIANIFVIKLWLFK